jgi:hypothetical protein
MRRIRYETEGIDCTCHKERVFGKGKKRSVVYEAGSQPAYYTRKNVLEQGSHIENQRLVDALWIEEQSFGVALSRNAGW